MPSQATPGSSGGQSRLYHLWLRWGSIGGVLPVEQAAPELFPYLEEMVQAAESKWSLSYASSYFLFIAQVIFDYHSFQFQGASKENPADTLSG